MICSLRIQLGKLAKFFCFENKKARSDVAEAAQEDIGVDADAGILSENESAIGNRAGLSYSLNDMRWSQWT